MASYALLHWLDKLHARKRSLAVSALKSNRAFILCLSYLHELLLRTERITVHIKIVQWGLTQSVCHDIITATGGGGDSPKTMGLKEVNTYEVAYLYYKTDINIKNM